MTDTSDLQARLEAMAADLGGYALVHIVAPSHRRPLLLEWQVGSPPNHQALTLEIREHEPGSKAYRVIQIPEGVPDGPTRRRDSVPVAVSYRGRDLAPNLRQTIAHLVDGLTATLVLPDVVAPAEPNRTTAPARPTPPPPQLQRSDRLSSPYLPTPAQRFHLDQPHSITVQQRSTFQRDGHILIRRAVSPEVLRGMWPAVLAALQRHWPPADSGGQDKADIPGEVEVRDDAYSNAFTQITDRWPEEPALAALALGERFASLAAQLLGVASVRLFCEDWLIKPPGALITPWHQDEAVMPFDTRGSVTAWLPFQSVGPNDGALRFARGSHRLGRLAVEDISDTSQAEFAAVITRNHLPIDRMPPMWLGDVSFHHGRTIHGAFANTGGHHRFALALHIFADDARVIRPTTPKMSRLLAHAMPDAEPGVEANSARWPKMGTDLTRRLETAIATAPQVLHGRGTLLATGEVVDLWTVDGCLALEPPDVPRTAWGALFDSSCDEAPHGVPYICSGLVEGHGHISYPTDEGTPVHTRAWMNARRDEYATTGVTLVRDMGATSDHICDLVDAPGLPRVQPSGLMVLPYHAPPFQRTDEPALGRAFEARVEAGAHWVKVFADWTSDYQGRENSGFTEADKVSYPVTVLRDAVDRAHALGGRVGAHCFTRAGAQVAIEAGVDALEHGWGVDERLLERMVALGTAWAPLVGIAGHMRRVAQRFGQTERVDWITRAVQRLTRILPLAEAAGIPILAGTDMFPQVTVADEVGELARLGLSTRGALAAGLWGARKYLGEPGIVDGAPADLVTFGADPRRSLTTLQHPKHIWIGGIAVDPARATVRPQFEGWDT